MSVVSLNPHEQQAHSARWTAAGLDPDIRAAEVAGAVLDYVTPAGAWAWTCAVMCPACGRPVPSRRKLHPGQPGRQAETCDADCYRFVRARLEYEAALAEVTGRMTAQRWAEERGRMWRALNGRGWNRGVRIHER